jgi:Ser/Thr protein kinase RdoA (MazF antagonist)
MMTGEHFRKQYRSTTAAQAALRNYHWLNDLASGVRMPALIAHRGDTLVFEHLAGHHVLPDDLPAAAAALGQLHAVAHRQHLHAAHLDQPYPIDPQAAVADFLTPRSGISAELQHLLRRPVALYKDANIRNFLVDTEGVAIIDFDDLTLAPFGYDLAKLIVSCAITHGNPGRRRVGETLDAYNTPLPESLHCPTDRLQEFATLHHRLTARYLGRHGYRYSWPAADPWMTSP